MSEDSERKDLKPRIDREVARLSRNYARMEKRTKEVILGLLQRAAFMRVSLEDLEGDLNENGFTEWFSQGEQSPYQRKRPVAELYNTMNANYQKIIKQLTDLLPKEAAKSKADGFDEFVGEREDA